MCLERDQMCLARVALLARVHMCFVCVRLVLKQCVVKYSKVVTCVCVCVHLRSHVHVPRACQHVFRERANLCLVNLCLVREPGGY